MSKVYFISDLHLGHKNLILWCKDTRGGHDVESHDKWLIDSINSVVRKRDTIWILGDLVWGSQYLHLLGDIIGYKKFILGNHDKMRVHQYAKYGRVMPSLVAYKGFWLSHAPIHPEELRGRKNIHGHTHSNSIDDSNYINVCVENLYGIPIGLDELRDTQELEK